MTTRPTFFFVQNSCKVGPVVMRQSHVVLVLLANEVGLKGYRSRDGDIAHMACPSLASSNLLYREAKSLGSVIQENFLRQNSLLVEAERFALQKVCALEKKTNVSSRRAAPTNAEFHNRQRRTRQYP